MNFISLHPNQLQSHHHEQAADLTARSFNRPNDEEMYTDTMNHLNSSENVQLAMHEQKLVGLSMVRNCLWRASA